MSGKHEKNETGGYGFATACFAIAAVLILSCITALVYHFGIESGNASASETQVPEYAAGASVPSASNETEPPAETQPETSPYETDGTEENVEMTALSNEISDYISGFDSKWCVYAQDPETGGSISCCQNVSDETPMVAASLIKLYIMGAVFERIEAGEISEDDVSGELTDMITVSDNTAANNLTKLLGGGDAAAGMAAVNEFAGSIGCLHTSMNRLMLEDNGKQNYTTAGDCGMPLRMIYDGSCVSKDASTKMLSLLLKQERTDKIPAGLPSGTKAANKTGELTGLSECDVAIVFGDKTDFILCIMSEPVSNAAAIESIKDISGMAYETFEK